MSLKIKKDLAIITVNLDTNLIDNYPYQPNISFSEVVRHAVKEEIIRTLKIYYENKPTENEELFEKNLNLFRLTENQRDFLRYFYNHKKECASSIKRDLSWNNSTFDIVSNSLINLNYFTLKNNYYIPTLIYESLKMIDIKEIIENEC